MIHFSCLIEPCFFQAPFIVHLHVGALFVIDVHAHCSHNLEVMGLLGGELREDSLHIVRAVSCQASLSSSTHCDMCPGNYLFKIGVLILLRTSSMSDQYFT